MSTEVPSLPDPRDPEATDRLLGIGERIVETALARGADAAEVFLLSSIGSSYSIEKNAIGFTSTGGESGIGLRVIKDRRVGFSYLTEPAKRGDAVASALDVAARADPGDFAFAAPAKHPSVDGLFDDAVNQLDTEEGLEAVKALIAGAREVHPGVTVSGGSFGFGAGVDAVVNSEGLAVAERTTDLGLGAYVVLKDGDEVTTGWKAHETNAVDALARDPAAVGREAATQAKDTLGAEPFGDGRDTTVVFHPHAAAALFEFITIPALYGDKAARGESIYADKLGESVVDPRLVVTEDPTMAGGLGSSASDAEGMPSRRVPLLEGGRVGSFLYDLGSAYEHGDGVSSATASAVRSGRLSDATTYKDPPAVSARQAVVTSTAAMDLDLLIGEVDSGILVHDLLGAHTANPTSGDFSVSSTVLFRIEDGALAGAHKPVMLAGNVPTLLEKGFVGCSKESEQTTGHFSPMGIKVPYTALSGVHVVGS